MDIVITVAGPDVLPSEYDLYPKPLIEIAGEPLIKVALRPFLDIPDIRLIFVVSDTLLEHFSFDEVLRQSFIHADVVVLRTSGETSGSLCTALLGVDELSDNEVLIFNYDQWLNEDVAELFRCFRGSAADFGALVFPSTHPRWSYARLDENNAITETSEKRPISNYAMAGFYYFRSKQIFLDSSFALIKKSAPIRDRFYISEVFNQCIYEGLFGLAVSIPSERYKKFSDVLDIKKFSIPTV